jgi:hypothetical protein
MQGRRAEKIRPARPGLAPGGINDTYARVEHPSQQFIVENRSDAANAVVKSAPGGALNVSRCGVLPSALQQSQAPNVRFGSKADIAAHSSNVRFTPKSGHRLSASGCLLCANSGH